MTQRYRRSFVSLVVAAMPLLASCQSPTDPDEVLEVDDFLETSASTNAFPSVNSAVSIGLEVWYDCRAYAARRWSR